MDWGGVNYENTELVKIAEQIYRYKERKKELELQLSEEMLHYQYVSKRKNLVIHEVLFRLLFIIPITLFIIITIENLYFFFLNAFLFYFDLRLIWRECKMIYLLLISIDTPFAFQYAQDHNLKTFQREGHLVTEAISMLQTEIEDLDRRTVELEAKRQAVLEEAKQKETENYEKPSASITANGKNAGKFVLREAGAGKENASQLYEYYLKEEQHINNYLIKLQGRIQYCDRKITEIEENFHNVRQKILILSIIFVLAIGGQSFFTGIWYSVTSLLCFIAFLGYIIYLERVCKRPVLLYLVEHESSLTREYAFLNNMLPVKNKRDELLEELEHYQRELKQIRHKRQEIVFV